MFPATPAREVPLAHPPLSKMLAAFVAGDMETAAAEAWLVGRGSGCPVPDDVVDIPLPWPLGILDGLPPLVTRVSKRYAETLGGCEVSVRLLDNGRVTARMWRPERGHKWSRPSWVLLHRDACPTDLSVDHINHGPLDNWDQNLHPATHKQNMANLTLRQDTTSGGTNIQRVGKRWRIRFTSRNTPGSAGVEANHGTYTTVDEAKPFRDAWNLHYKGREFGNLYNPAMTDAEAAELRAASPARNRIKTSKYRGVRFHKDCQKWLAKLTIKGKAHPLGLFPDEDAAARAVNAAIIEHGLDRKLNVIDEPLAVAA